MKGVQAVFLSALALSLLTHLSFLLLAKTPAPRPEDPVVPVEVVNLPQVQRGGVKGGRSAGAGAVAPKLSMRSLMPSPAEVGVGNDEAAVGGSVGAEGSRAPFATRNAFGLEEYASLFSFFDSIWKTIDAAVDYPYDFAKLRIQGSVSARVVVDGRGVLKGTFIDVKGENSLLEMYVLAALMHTLTHPLPERVWAKRNAIALNLLFEFETFSDYSLRVRNRGNSMKNSLLFTRFAYVDPYLEEWIDKIFTRYIPPILPLGGGFMIDFVRLYRLIESIDEPDPDKLRIARVEMMKQELANIVRKTGNGRLTLPPKF